MAGRFNFLPTPLEIIVRPEGAEPVLARVLVSIERAEHPDAGQPPNMIVRLRIENETEQEVTLVTERLLLVGSDLDSFGAPTVDGDPVVPPRGTTTFRLEFPFPDGMDFDAPQLTGVNLRFALQHGESETTSTATLERYVAPDPGRSDVRWNVGFGTYF